MAKVNNSTAQNKWNSLKGSAGVSLSHVVQGKASSSDFQRVQNILQQQSSLASQIFSQALATAEKQAKKFQSSYAAVRGKDNKELLSSFEVALNAELQKVTPDIVGQLKEIIETSSAANRDDIDKSMGSRFDAFKDILPKEKDVPTIQDILQANALQSAEIHSDAQVRWTREEPALIEKIAQVFQTTLRNLAETINREKAQSQAGGMHGGQPALAGPSAPLMLGYSPSPVQDVEDRQSVLAQGMAMLRGPAGSEGVSDVGAKDVGGGKSTSGSSTMVVALNPAAQRELTTAAQAQTDFYSRVKSLLPSPGQTGKGDAEEEGKEEKKADTWWRSFKNWFGGDEDKKKKKDDKFSWIKSLGAILALMILNPKLFTALGEGIKGLLTWENLKGAAEKSWDWVKTMSSSVMEAISNMLGGTMKSPTQADATNAKDGKKDLTTTANKPGDKKHADLSHLTPEQQKQFDAMGAANHEGTGNVTGASKGWNSFGADWLNKGLSMVGITTPAMKDYNLAHTDTNSKSPTYGHIIVDGKDKGKNPDFKPQTSVASSSGRSSINPPLPQTMPTGAGASTTFSESPSVKYSPGVSLPPGDPSQPAGGSAAMQPQKGAPQLGIGSFGFNAANSDSLTLMNTYHFTGA
jgi:hypothetical protein